MSEQEKQLKERVEEFLNSELGNDIKLVLAYTIKKTKTTKDDEVLERADEIADVIASNISQIADQNPDNKAFRGAVIRLLKWGATQTKTPWDDRFLALLDKVM